MQHATRRRLLQPFALDSCAHTMELSCGNVLFTKPANGPGLSSMCGSVRQHDLCVHTEAALQHTKAAGDADTCMLCWCCCFREYAQTVASHVGMLTMSQLGAAERRKEWNREVAELRSTCQVRRTPHLGQSTFALKSVAGADCWCTPSCRGICHVPVQVPNAQHSTVQHTIAQPHEQCINPGKPTSTFVCAGQVHKA